MSSTSYQLQKQNYKKSNPDSSKSSKKHSITRANSFSGEQKVVKTTDKWSRSIFLGTEQAQDQNNEGLSSFVLGINNRNQEIYQRMSDIYLAKQIKLKLKNQEQQIKKCVYQKRKENVLANSYFKLFSLKDKSCLANKFKNVTSETIRSPYQSFQSFQQKN